MSSALKIEHNVYYIVILILKRTNLFELVYNIYYITYDMKKEIITATLLSLAVIEVFEQLYHW